MIGDGRGEGVCLLRVGGQRRRRLCRGKGCGDGGAARRDEVVCGGASDRGVGAEGVLHDEGYRGGMQRLSDDGGRCAIRGNVRAGYSSDEGTQQ